MYFARPYACGHCGTSIGWEVVAYDEKTDTETVCERVKGDAVLAEKALKTWREDDKKHEDTQG